MIHPMSKMEWNGQKCFSVRLKKLKGANGNYNALLNTPFGDDLLGAFAEAALKGENLGKVTK